MWRVFHGVLPMDDNLKIPMVSKCYCCDQGNMESTNHLLLHGKLARYVWSYFRDVFGLSNPSFYNVMSLFHYWAKQGKAQSMERMCYTITSIMITWEIGKERNRARHEEGYSRSSDQQKRAVIYRVRYWLLKLTEVYKFKHHSKPTFIEVARWLGLREENIELLMPRILVWEGPIFQPYCLSTNGGSEDGFVSGGRVIRKWIGDHVSNFFTFYGEGTNNYAEIRALLEGVLYCHLLGIYEFKIQSDSLLLVKALNRKGNIPYRLRKWWQLLEKLLRASKCTFKHVYRELNQVADWLANLGKRRWHNGSVNLHHHKEFMTLLWVRKWPCHT